MTREEARTEIEEEFKIFLEGASLDDDILEEKMKENAELRKVVEANRMAIEALEQEPILDRDCEHCSKTYGTLGCCTTVSNKWVYSCKEGQREYLLNKIRSEIKEWYWQADKQALAKDPCVVDAMVDLFIRTIDKYKTESEG